MGGPGGLTLPLVDDLGLPVEPLGLLPLLLVAGVEERHDAGLFETDTQGVPYLADLDLGVAEPGGKRVDERPGALGLRLDEFEIVQACGAGGDEGLGVDLTELAEAIGGLLGGVGQGQGEVPAPFHVAHGDQGKPGVSFQLAVIETHRGELNVLLLETGAEAVGHGDCGGQACDEGAQGHDDGADTGGCEGYLDHTGGGLRGHAHGPELAGDNVQALAEVVQGVLRPGHVPLGGRQAALDYHPAAGTAGGAAVAGGRREPPRRGIPGRQRTGGGYGPGGRRLAGEVLVDGLQEEVGQLEFTANLGQESGRFLCRHVTSVGSTLRGQRRPHSIGVRTPGA